jgi:hypothetical protein
MLSPNVNINLNSGIIGKQEAHKLPQYWKHFMFILNNNTFILLQQCVKFSWKNQSYQYDGIVSFTLINLYKWHENDEHIKSTYPKNYMYKMKSEETHVTGYSESGFSFFYHKILLSDSSLL